MPKLHLENLEQTIEADPEQTVLDALRAAGIRALAGCRYGACRTCAAQLHEGKISMPPGTALLPEHLAEGYFLPCVARARTDCTITVALRRPLLPTLPWTD